MQENRRYVLVNYTPEQKDTIQKKLNTSSYTFSEPFANHRRGLIVMESRSTNEIARLIGIDYKMMICPLTEVHVMYLNYEKGAEYEQRKKNS